MCYCNSFSNLLLLHIIQSLQRHNKAHLSHFSDHIVHSSPSKTQHNHSHRHYRFISFDHNYETSSFAFGHQPLQSNPPIPLTLFICIAYLPIKINHMENQEDPSKIQSENKENIANQEQPSRKALHPVLNLIQKIIFQALLWIIYQVKQHMHPKIMLAYYCAYAYVTGELIMAMASALAWALLGLEPEPHFNKPYMATSLQDFWGKRWNLDMPNALRSVVYKPLKKRVSSRTAFGAMLPTVVAVMGTFVVSGLAHETVPYYFARMRPSWEITGFFLLQGLGVAVEIAVKKVLLMKRITWRMNRLVSGVLVLGFVMVSAVCLFFPPILRCNVVARLEREVGAVVEFLNCSLNMLTRH
ncbi:hypothetical protein Syun_008380 [Stephania yunnanensis]|uniref:Wax synthase domain-containing protein n=1 Tax=Stephania yunnanensis TaxID=152371 RepID=A0AAP0PRB1_9MAGN